MSAGLDIAAFEALNQLSGRSFTLDALFALAIENPVIKGGPIAACFIFAWWHGDAGDAQRRRRAVLLLTLAALFVIAPVMKAVSTAMPQSPRPIVQAEQTYELDNGQLVAREQIAYSPPATGLAARIAQDVRSGTIASNNLASFPSDHAALFAAFAAGIFIAMRSAGLVALGWFVIGVALPRVVTGLHWPTDMLAGAIAGVAVLALVLLAGRVFRPVMHDRVLPLVDRFPALSQAVIFLLLVEAASAMETSERLVELVAHTVGG